MNFDIVLPAAFAYAGVMLTIGIIASGNYHYTDGTEKRTWARVFITAPIWPVMVVAAIGYAGILVLSKYREMWGAAK